MHILNYQLYKILYIMNFNLIFFILKIEKNKKFLIFILVTK